MDYVTSAERADENQAIRLPATNLLPCWQKTAVTVLPLIQRVGKNPGVIRR